MVKVFGIRTTIKSSTKVVLLTTTFLEKVWPLIAMERSMMGNF